MIGKRFDEFRSGSEIGMGIGSVAVRTDDCLEAIDVRFAKPNLLLGRKLKKRWIIR